MYAGAGSAATAWFLNSDFLALIGVMTALAGFAVNFYFRWKQDRRDQIEHELRVLAIRNDKAGGL